MLLCLDVGNTQIHGGVFADDAVQLQFRKTTHPLGSSDELGVFFAAVLRENNLKPDAITRVAVCSVVPAALHPINGACVKYFRCEPFVLQAGVKTGLKVRYRNPHEVGSDRIANAVGAAQRFPGRAMIVVDCGTATTFDVVTSSGDYLGGAILPGVGLSAEVLSSRTAKLPSIEILRPTTALGRTSAESIQSGLYHGHVGAMHRLLKLLAAEAFPEERPVVVGTGGFARMFESEGIFDEIVPELVLRGLKRAEELNREPTSRAS
jgi:type III pantothenate kinase